MFSPLHILKHLLLLSIAGLLASCLFEEYTDCVAECDSTGLVEHEYVGSTLELFKVEDSTKNYTFIDSISPSDFGMDIKFLFADQVIRRAPRACCGNDYFLSSDDIESMELFMIHTFSEDTTDITDLMNLTEPSGESSPWSEFSLSEIFYNHGMITLKPTSDLSMPPSATFAMKTTLISGKVLYGRSRSILFQQS